MQTAKAPARAVKREYQVSHLQWCLRARRLSFLCDVAKQTWLIHTHFVTFSERFVHDVRTPTAHATHEAVESARLQNSFGKSSGGCSAHNDSRHPLGSPCMKAFSPSATVPSERAEARIRIMMFVDATSGVGQLHSISSMSGSLNPCTHHRAFAMCPLHVSFQRTTSLRTTDVTALNQRHPSTLFRQLFNFVDSSHRQVSSIGPRQCCDA